LREGTKTPILDRIRALTQWNVGVRAYDLENLQYLKRFGRVGKNIIGRVEDQK